MAADESAAEFCQATRDAFGNLIQKPPLSDKLLCRPPFRFLHDVICAVIRQSGFLNDLYSTDELDAKNVTEKDAKMAFLQKCLDSVQFANGEKLDVNVGKVVAGKDAEKTNLFLQKLAQAAKSTSPDASQQIVKRVLAGDKPTDENLLNNSGGSAGSNKENRESKPADKKRSSSKEKREKSKDSTDQKKRTSSKDKDKDKDKDKPKKSKSKEDEKSSKKKSDSKSKKEEKKEKGGAGEKKKREKSSKTKSSSPERETSEPKIILTNGHAEEMSVEIDHAQDDEMQPEFSQDPPASSGSRANSNSARPYGRDQESTLEPPAQPRMTRSARPMTAGGRPGTASGGRPGTASGTRKAPPRLKRRELGEVEVPAPRIGSAESQRETTGLIVTQDDPTVFKNDGQNEEDNFIVEEPIPTLGDVILAEEAAAGGGDFVDADQLDPSDHGALVGKMLETTKQLEAELGEDSLPERPLVVFDEREREKIRKETSKTQESVQQLTRTAHPLGRLVDYLQEDVDSMIKELEQWQGEYKKNSVKLRQIQKTERSDLEPLRLKLNELDEQIREKGDGIAAVRGEILNNQEKLLGLINSVGK